MVKKDARTNLNPSLSLTFLIVAVTGVMLLFDIGGGGTEHLHEWMSVVFLILSIVHLALNWKPLWVYLKRGPIALSLVGVCLLSALLLFSGDDTDDHGRDSREGTRQARHLDFSHRK